VEAVRVNPFVAVCGGTDESVTCAMKPAVPKKFAFPEIVPDVASIVSPSMNRVVGEIRVIDHWSAPLPLEAFSVVL
jgi:hypothetical protein